jgi:DNA-binding MarR family transcriptional regulator
MNPTMVSRVLTKLEGDKLIQRSRSADDARTAILSSTKSGHEVLERVRMQSALYLDKGLSQLSHNDFQVLVDALPVLEKLIELTPRSAPSE